MRAMDKKSVPEQRVKVGELRDRRSSGSNMPRGSARGKSIGLKLWPRPSSDQNARAGARRWWFNSLMTHMADGAGTRGKVGMMMPHFSDHRAQQ